MGGEIRPITVRATTLDVEHWHPGWLAAAKACRSGYHEWAFDELRDAIEVAVEQFVAAHPGLFNEHHGVDVTFGGP